MCPFILDDVAGSVALRPIAHVDIASVALAIMELGDDVRPKMIFAIFTKSDAADAYRKRFRRAHPLWGNGSLMSVVVVRDLPGEPFFGDPVYCRAFVDVLEALILWKCEKRTTSMR